MPVALIGYGSRIERGTLPRSQHSNRLDTLLPAIDRLQRSHREVAQVKTKQPKLGQSRFNLKLGALLVLLTKNTRKSMTASEIKNGIDVAESSL